MLFGVNKYSCIAYINGYLGYLSMQGELEKNKVSFLRKMSQNNVIKFMFEVLRY